MPIISLTMRTSAYAEQTDAVAVVLAKITHPNLVAPVYLSSDPTQRLLTDPLVYGTISNGIQYLFVLMTAIIPDEHREGPPKTQLVLENVESDMAKVIRSFTSYASVDLSVVMASNPNFVERSFTNMQIVKASYDADRVTLDISREPFTQEPWPSARMTRARFPGLWH